MAIKFMVKISGKVALIVAVGAMFLFIESCKKEEISVRKPPRISMSMYNSAVGQIAARMDNGNTLYAGVDITTFQLEYGIVNAEGAIIYYSAPFTTAVSQYKANAVAIDDNFFIMSSTYDPASNGNVFVLKKIAATGQEVWEKRYSIPEAGVYNSKLMATKNGELLMVGYSYNTKKSPAVISIEAIRLDKDGSVQWQSTTPAPYYYDVGGCIEKADGGFLFLSKDYSTNELVFMDLDESGNLLNQARVVYTGSLGCITATKDKSGYLFVGYQNGDIDLIKLSNNYGTKWSKQLGKPEIVETASDIIELQDGSYLITGTAEGSLTNAADVLFLKADINGDGKIYKAYGEMGSQYGYQIELTGTNKVTVYGLAMMTAKNTNEYEVFSISLDENGNY